jgi:uncharacterized membrane protein
MEKETTNTQNKFERKHKVRIISGIGILLSIIGLADTTYLTIAHYTTKVILACPSTGIINCQKVTSSTYSEIHGIPAAVLGLIFFSVMLIYQLPMMWSTTNKFIRNTRVLYSIAGLVSVFWFVYVELHKLDAICLYCTGVHILTFFLFVTTIIGTSIITAEKE